VAEHPEAFDHAGLLVDWPPGTAGLPFMTSTDSEASCTAIALRYKYYYTRREKCKSGRTRGGGRGVTAAIDVSSMAMRRTPDGQASTAPTWQRWRAVSRLVGLPKASGSHHRDHPPTVLLPFAFTARGPSAWTIWRPNPCSDLAPRRVAVADFSLSSCCRSPPPTGSEKLQYSYSRQLRHSAGIDREKLTGADGNRTHQGPRSDPSTALKTAGPTRNPDAPELTLHFHTITRRW